MIDIYLYFLFFFFKQKTAYEMRISDWSSDVCSSDLSVYEAATQSSLTRRNRNFSPFSRLHVFNRPVADTPSHKSQGRMTDGCRHPAHLTVSPFADCQLGPTVGYALAEADRRIAGPENGIGTAFDLGRPGKAVFQTNDSTQRIEACLCGVAFDLYEIGFEIGREHV